MVEFISAISAKSLLFAGVATATVAVSVVGVSQAVQSYQDQQAESQIESAINSNYSGNSEDSQDLSDQEIIEAEAEAESEIESSEKLVANSGQSQVNANNNSEVNTNDTDNYNDNDRQADSIEQTKSDKPAAKNPNSQGTEKSESEEQAPEDSYVNFHLAEFSQLKFEYNESKFGSATFSEANKQVNWSGTDLEIYIFQGFGGSSIDTANTEGVEVVNSQLISQFSKYGRQETIIFETTYVEAGGKYYYSAFSEGLLPAESLGINNVSLLGISLVTETKAEMDELKPFVERMIRSIQYDVHNFFATNKYGNYANFTYNQTFFGEVKECEGAHPDPSPFVEICFTYSNMRITFNDGASGADVSEVRRYELTAKNSEQFNMMVLDVENKCTFIAASESADFSGGFVGLTNYGISDCDHSSVGLTELETIKLIESFNWLK